jgi:hypothetical protein
MAGVEMPSLQAGLTTAGGKVGAATDALQLIAGIGQPLMNRRSPTRGLARCSGQMRNCCAMTPGPTPAQPVIEGS